MKCVGRTGYVGFSTIEDVSTFEESQPIRFVQDGVLGQANSTAVQISVGASYACAVLLDGSCKCWGSSSTGALGLGRGVERVEDPAEHRRIDLGDDRAIEVSASGGHTCVLTHRGSVRCFGIGAQGRLGTGLDTSSVYDPADSPLPVRLDQVGGRAVSVEVGNRHSCAVLETGEVRCWGVGRYLGLGSLDNVADPSLVAPVQFGPSASLMKLACGEVIRCVSPASLPMAPSSMRSVLDGVPAGSLDRSKRGEVSVALPRPSLWLSTQIMSTLTITDQLKGRSIVRAFDFGDEVHILRGDLVAFSPSQLMLPAVPFEEGTVELGASEAMPFSGAVPVLSTAGGSTLCLFRNWSPVIALGLVEKDLARVTVGDSDCGGLRVAGWDTLCCNAPPGTGVQRQVLLAFESGIPGVLPN